ncbi:hypothetical protein [Algiphilus sp.]|uniref:hypothetical protein n=1 Tax=Algiphilus sp. TaxID=1872431 RepID=UPI0025BA4064|nr:hypothetical protein [Algiphilus sp.]MCK5772030.1 hypothetical protein [Algiphilus sp.]
MPTGLRQYLEQTPGLKVDLEAAPEAWTVVDHGRHMQAQGAIVTGYALCYLKSELPRGEWLEGLAARRMSARTAQHMMAVYRFACRLAQLEAVSALAEIGAHKMLSFQDWDDEEIRALTAGEEVRGLTYEQVAEASTRELLNHQREWRDDHDLQLQAERERADKLGIELDTAQARIRALESGVEERNARNPLPPWYRHLRNDVHLSTEAMAQHLAELQQIANEWVFGASRTTDDEEQLARMAAGSCFHNLAGVVAEGQAVLKRLAAEFGEKIAADDDLLLLRADDDELQHLSRNRAQIIRDIEADKAARRHQRETEEAAKPRGRGRPKGARDSKPRQRRGA